MTDPNHPLDAHRRLPLISLGVNDKGAYCLRFRLKSWINDLRIEIHFGNTINYSSGLTQARKSSDRINFTLL